MAIELGKKGTLVHIKELSRLAAVGDPRANDTRVFSKSLWRDCPLFELEHGTRDGFSYYTDFPQSMVQATNVAAASTTLIDPFAAFTDNDASATITTVVEPTDAIGSFAMNTGAQNLGVNVAVFGQKNTGSIINGINLAGTAGAGLASAASTPYGNKVWLEARIKPSSVATNHIAFFFGLMAKARAITLGTIATGGAAAAAVDHVGFLKKVAATTAVGTTTGDGTSTDVNAAAGVLAAATYINLGLKWDGLANGGLGLLKFYINGVADSTTLNSGSTQFPEGSGLLPYFGVLGGSAASADSITVDWFRFAVQRV